MARARIWFAPLAALAAAAFGADGAAPDAAMPSIMASGYYAREPVDRDWSIRLRGTIPSLCGAWLLVYDPTGRVFHAGPVPHGDYTDDRPFTVTIPADHRTGDCMIRLVGGQEDMLGLRLPLTDLPQEVYGGVHFAVRSGKAGGFCFKGLDASAAKPSQEEILTQAAGGGPAPGAPGPARVTLGAYKGHLTVKKGTGEVVAGTRAPREDTEIGSDKYSNLTTFPTVPGETYRLELECLYFSSSNTLYLAVEPDRWFRPDPGFESIKWWTLK